jgi:hypothetical protein
MPREESAKECVDKDRDGFGYESEQHDHRPGSGRRLAGD